MTCGEQSHVNPLACARITAQIQMPFPNISTLSLLLCWGLSFSERGFILRVVFLKYRFDRELVKQWTSCGFVV